MKKQEYRTKTRIFSLLLSVSIAGSLMPMRILAEEAVDITSYQSDLSDKFNYSNWGILGESITSESVELSRAGAFLFTQNGSIVNTFKLNDEITFTFDTSTYSVNENNFYREPLNETAVFTDHEKYVKTIYMGIVLHQNSSDKISPVVTYTDGTQQTISFDASNFLQKASEKPNYAGAMTVTAPHLGAKSWKKPIDSEGVVGEGSSSDGIAFYSIDVDETKVIDNIAIKNTPNSMIAYYAIGGSVMSNSELRAYVDMAQEFDSVSAENADTIKVAKGYADELIERNAVTESEVKKINSLYEDITWYASKTDSKQNMINLSDYANMDMLAPLGTAVDNEFDSGFECTYTDMWQKFTANGVINALLDDGKTVTFSMDEKKYEAGEKDSVYLKAGETKVTIPSGGEMAEKVYFIWGSRGDNRQAKVKVNYSDGTYEEKTVAVYRFISRDNAPAKVGSLMFNWNTYYPVYDEATGKYIITSKSATAGINIYGVDLDATKTPVSYEITAAEDYDTAIYAMTEVTMSNADMTEYIASVNEIDLVRTEEDEEMVRKAWAYAQELNRRHAVKLEDNAYVASLFKQAQAQKDIYIDLASVLDTDLIVKTGDVRQSDYNGRDDALYKVMGDKVTLISPRDFDYTDIDSGREFMLSGGYNGNGNDSVRAGDKAVSIKIGNKLLSRISFLVDCIDTNVNRKNGADLKAIITYDDGTEEEVKGQIRRSDTWYTNQYGAFAEIEYAHYNADTNSYADGRLAVEDEGDKYSLLSNFGLNIPTAKPIEKIELCANMGYTYHILGVTGVPHKNEELENNLVIFEDVAGAEDVNQTNAKAALLGASSVLELYKRGYELDSDSLDLANEVYMASSVYLAGGEVLEFRPNFSVENGIAQVNAMMSNTTEKDAPYVIIIAAYDSNNELCEVVAGETKILRAGSVAVKDTFSMKTAAESGLKYKAMIWDGLETMQPYAVSETR